MSAPTVTHRLQVTTLTESPTISVGTIGPACPTRDRVIYFSEEPTCPVCRAAPVMATCGARHVDANGAPVEVPQQPKPETPSWLIA